MPRGEIIGFWRSQVAIKECGMEFFAVTMWANWNLSGNVTRTNCVSAAVFSPTSATLRASFHQRFMCLIIFVFGKQDNRFSTGSGVELVREKEISHVIGICSVQLDRSNNNKWKWRKFCVIDELLRPQTILENPFLNSLFHDLTFNLNYRKLTSVILNSPQLVYERLPVATA